MSQANPCPPSSNTSRRLVGTCGSSARISSGGSVTASLIETKRDQRVHVRWEDVFAGNGSERALQVLRQRRAEVEWLAGHRVIEREPRCVEEMPLGRKSGHTTSSAASIDVIAHDRMADRREMNADLVSPSGMEMGTKKIPRIEPSKAYDVGLGRPTLNDDCHALPVSRVAGYRLVDREVIRREVSPGHHRVAPLDPPGGDGAAQKPVGAVRLGDDKEPGGLLVEPVDHTRAFGVAFLRQLSAPAEQGVDQRAAPVPRGGVHPHPGRLVYH